MSWMHVRRLSQEGAEELLDKILKGIAAHAKHNPETTKDMLDCMIGDFLDPLSQDDFFGTEGWKHEFGIDD